MDMNVDHYAVLGLPSGEEGAKLSAQEITAAYKRKAMELHPDKRPGDPNANSDFQKLGASYDILRDEKKRRLFDVSVRMNRHRHHNVEQESEQQFKKRKWMSDFDERQTKRSAYFGADSGMGARDREFEEVLNRMAQKYELETDTIVRAYFCGKASANIPPRKKRNEDFFQYKWSGKWFG